MRLNVRRLFTACAAAVGLGLAPAGAADYPDHPIKVIVPFAAGGPTWQATTSKFAVKSKS